MPTISTTHTGNRRAGHGFTLVEILVVVVVLGVLAAVVAFSVGGSSESGEAGACGADSRTLTQAANVYMTKQQVDELPAIGTSANRFELLLIDAGLLKQVSMEFDLREDGTVTTNGSPCT